jgi:hypothetical protein
MRSFDGKDPFDLALAHGQEAFCAFLDHARLSAGTTLPAEYARDERDLVWKQRKRRKRLLRQLAGARLSKNEEHGALDVLRATDTEEWMHLEGHYLSRGLALHTIATLKKKRSMH